MTALQNKLAARTPSEIKSDEILRELYSSDGLLTKLDGINISMLKASLKESRDVRHLDHSYSVYPTKNAETPPAKNESFLGGLFNAILMPYVFNGIGASPLTPLFVVPIMQ